MEWIEGDFVQQSIEKQPFSNASAERFLEKWLEMHDSIIPVFVDQNNWQINRSGNIIKHNEH